MRQWLFITASATWLILFAACAESENPRLGNKGDPTDNTDANGVNSDDTENHPQDSHPNTPNNNNNADSQPPSSDAPPPSDPSGDSTDKPDFIDTEFVPVLTPEDANNANRKDRLTCTYRTVSEDENSFEGIITVGNANKEYVWNGYIFTIYSVDFLTTSTITESKTDDFITINHKRVDDETIRFDFGWMSVFHLNELITFRVKGQKKGLFPYPVRCMPNYVRGDVVYPEYQDLPRSFWKNKTTLSQKDLIHDVDDYYRQEVSPTTEGIFVYHPTHPTQINIGLPDEHMKDLLGTDPNAPLTVNGYTDLQLFVPSRMLAMGIGFSYQWFKFNPNYFLALGTKENFCCGLIPEETWKGGVPITYKDKNYSWYILQGSNDGPFQQETPNFIDMSAFFPDYFPKSAQHDDYTHVTDVQDEMHPQWATSVVSSALSSVVTRETLWASQGDNYHRMVFEAKDPWAELSIITFAYNRGIYGFCSQKLFSDMDRLLNAPNVGREYGLGGFADHVPQINGITANANAETKNIYDAQLSWPDIEAFFAAIHFIYGQGDPTPEQWQKMLDDVHAAFDILKQHWGGETISYRFDFLTLMRVAQKHLPNPTNVRPTSQTWKERATQLGPC
ncbi:MAG: hypothetical protein M0R76_10970 [Proteobacteria bacterium]|nr:hypothetical protein [Pseudomonadota bacterium]